LSLSAGRCVGGKTRGSLFGEGDVMLSSLELFSGLLFRALLHGSDPDDAVGFHVPDMNAGMTKDKPGMSSIEHLIV